MATWDDVRELAPALPEAEGSTSYRQPLAAPAKLVDTYTRD